MEAGQRVFGAWLYVPTNRPIEGALMLSPGLSPQGPAHLRMARLAKILAASGVVVCSPFMPDYFDLRVSEQSIADFARAFDAFLEQPEVPKGVKPGVLSVSFGSLLALRLISSPKYRDKVCCAATFGGYADWNEAVHFSLTGEVDGVKMVERDALNRPLAYINTLEDIEGAPADGADLINAWKRYIYLTWGYERYRRLEEYQCVAEALALRVPEAQRELFLRGVGAVGYEDYGDVKDALKRRGEKDRYLDPLPYLGGISCPVYLVHSTDDAVIPCNQMQRLAGAMPSGLEVQTYLTGLYSHSGATGGLIQRLPSMVDDFATLGGILGVLAKVCSGESALR